MNKPPSQAQAAAEIDAWMATLQQPVLRDLKGITDEEMEALYALAYHHYQAGHRQEALQRFKLLVTLDPLEQRFWLGLGGAAQRLGHFSEAIGSYATAALLNIHDPRPLLAAAECHLHLGQLHEAESALLALERYCPYSEACRIYRAKGRILRQKLSPHPPETQRSPTP